VRPMGESDVFRLDCLRALAELLDDELTVVALGGTTDEWNHVRPSDANFFNVGMGTNLPLAMGLAFALPHRRIVLIDTDGCQLMTLGALCTFGNYPPANLHVFVMDNQSYAFTGNQPSATAGKTDLRAVAQAVGIENAVSVADLEAFVGQATRLLSSGTASYLVARVETPRPEGLIRGFDHIEAKYRFVRHIEQVEGLRIMSVN
jgi:sulfopyruvate decarboxylase subunit beta